MSIKDSIRKDLDFCDEEIYPLQTNSELNGLDPEFLYDSAHDEDIRVKLRTLPDKVDVLEINHFEGGNHSISTRSLNEGQLCAWLDQVNQAPAHAQEPPEREIIGGLRLIMGRSMSALQAEKLPVTFPHEMEDIETGRPLPFTTSVFEQIIKAFHLPSITPRAFITDQSHFLRRTISTKGFVGYTMRRPTWGVLAMNICLSISYDTATGMTYALLHGCSDTQQAFIRQQLRSLASLANHPLLLPVLFSAHQRQLVHKQTRRLWESLLRVETASWQTDVPGVGSWHIPIESDTGQDLRGDYTQMTKETLGVIQLASGWQSTLKDIITGMDEIEQSLRRLSNKFQALGDSMETARDSFSEWLRFTRHQCRVLFGQLEYIDKRGQAQMTAVCVSLIDSIHTNKCIGE